MAMKRFWAHSYKNRRLAEEEQAKRELAHQQRVIAEAALAGWRFERIAMPRPAFMDGEAYAWGLWSPNGGFCGTNRSLFGAASYALEEMNDLVTASEHLRGNYRGGN